MDLLPKKYKEIDFDSVETSEKAVEILRTKKCLHDAFVWRYNMILRLREKYLRTDGKMLEIGSGGGFFKDIKPDIITSDVQPISNVDIVLDAQKLPFDNESLDTIVAMSVLHHIPDVTKFFKEALRVLKIEGGIICIEPNWSPLARFIFKNFHPEPFDIKAERWQLDTDKPFSGSNQALSYILLKRDRKKFESMFPQLQLAYRRPFDFIRYQMTGGIWLKQKAPDWFFPLFTFMEYLLKPLMPLLGLRHIFVLRKIKN